MQEIDKSLPFYSYIWIIILLYWFSFHLVRFFYPGNKTPSLTFTQSSDSVTHNPLADALLIIPNNIHLFIIALCFTFFHTYTQNSEVFFETLWKTTLFISAFLVIQFYVIKLFLWSVDLVDYNKSIVYYRKRQREILAHLLSLLAVSLYFVGSPKDYGFFALICIAVILIYTYTEFSMKNLNFVLKNPLVFFLYICTVEIFPALVLGKVLVSL